jgi:YHS domain-containing protein
MHAFATQNVYRSACLLVLAAAGSTAFGGETSDNTPDRSNSSDVHLGATVGRVTVLDFLPGLSCAGCAEYIRGAGARIPSLAGVDHAFLVPIHASEAEDYRMMLEDDVGRPIRVYADAEVDLSDRFDLADVRTVFAGLPVTVVLDSNGTEVSRRIGMHASDFIPHAELTARLDKLMRDANLDQYNLTSKRPAIMGYDPIAYFTAREARMGSKQFSSRYRGVSYLFATEENRLRFAADPERYLPAYGGWCATAMADGQKVDVDPTNFKITGGRLFLFYRGWLGDARKEWDWNESDLTRRADRQWNKLSPDTPMEKR